jgi:hypothetical protein
MLYGYPREMTLAWLVLIGEIAFNFFITSPIVYIFVELESKEITSFALSTNGIP